MDSADSFDHPVGHRKQGWRNFNRERLCSLEVAALEAGRLVSLAKPSTALSQDAEVGVKWNAQRGCRASHLRGIMAQTPHGAPKVPS